MLFTKALGVLASLCAAVAAHPAPSATSEDAIQASTLPSKQALYSRVFSEAVVGLLSNVSSLPPDSIASPRRRGGLKPHFQRELVDKVTVKAVRQLLPPSHRFANWTSYVEFLEANPGVNIKLNPSDFYSPVDQDLKDYLQAHPGVDVRPDHNWSRPINVTGRAEVARPVLPRDLPFKGPDAPFNKTSCPIFPSLPRLGPGYLNWTTCPPTWYPLPGPWTLNQTAPVNLTDRFEPHQPILPRDELRSTVVKKTTPKDLRASLLAQAKLAGLSTADMDVVDKTIDDAQEIVYAAQIRTANVMHNKYGSSYRVTERKWCPCKLVGCKTCPYKVETEKGASYDHADAVMAHLRS